MTTRQIVIGEEVMRGIMSHGEETYNHECCGALLGNLGDPPVVTRYRKMKNINTDWPTRRYSIDPLELIRVEEEAEGEGLELIGIYHSHPDHPARPSQYDLDHSFPNLSYVVMSVEKGKTTKVTSWRRREGEPPSFDEEQILSSIPEKNETEGQT